MGDTTAIEWADRTFNPWIGCTKVGPGCDHCYAEAWDSRFDGGDPHWGPGAPRRRTGAQNWEKPHRWEAGAAEFFKAHGRRQRVFCASLADVFDNEVDPGWRADLFRLIEDTPNLDWMLLTKRIGNVLEMLPQRSRHMLPDNLWVGMSIVNQAEWDRDKGKMALIPARVRFLSMEPLLGPVVLGPDISIVDWIIVGGESGPHARAMHPVWAHEIMQECEAAQKPFLFKQWGEWYPVGRLPAKPIGSRLHGRVYRPEQIQWLPDDGMTFVRSGKKVAGRLLAGAEYNGFP